MLTRREFVQLGAAVAIVAAASISWDVLVNEGKPGGSEEEEPPQ